MRDVAIVGFAQSRHVRREEHLNEVEVLMPVLNELYSTTGMDKGQIDFTCSGSSDYLAGVPFSFVTILDAIGPWPPIKESHVEMDGAWAVYEAWVKIQTGEADTAMVYSYGKSSPGSPPAGLEAPEGAVAPTGNASVRDVLTRQLDPYYLQPLWPDSVSLAALQARALIDAGKATERDFAEVASRSRASAMSNRYAQVAGQHEVDDILAGPYLASPLRKHDCAPISDGACAMILAAGDVAREACDRPAWIRGIDHRIEAHSLGVRDLTDSPSTRIAGQRAGVANGPVDVAELHAPFSSQELILVEALGLGPSVEINPSGGALGANPIMAAGQIRLGEVARRIISGECDRGVAHATGGPCLQQNLVAVLEGE